MSAEQSTPSRLWLPPEVIQDRGYVKWHLSISHVERDPTWDEIAGARYALVPDEATMVQVLPPRDEYLNLHEHCFHLWEIDPDPRFT